MEASRKALSEMVIIGELSFKFVENDGFRRFCNILQPNFQRNLERPLGLPYRMNFNTQS